MAAQVKMKRTGFQERSFNKSIGQPPAERIAHPAGLERFRRHSGRTNVDETDSGSPLTESPSDRIHSRRRSAEGNPLTSF
jgi:hypothetical protein